MIAIDALIVTAMPDESAPFVERADFVGQPTQVGHAVHRALSFDGRGVLLVQCGIGLVNAATAAAVALNGTKAHVLISAGSAGGIGASVRVGDVVVGSEYVYSGADARAFGYSLGQVPGMPAVYEGDDALLKTAANADVPDLRVLTGAMLSGDTFIDATMVDAIRASFPDALSTDMESAALAQTAHLYGVPFLSVRGISDLCGPAADSDFLQHVDDAAERSARVVISSLSEITSRY
ncbi:5'-methylthioadenosine/adenosylhomocysteine nucleosidase [Cellulomonas cellasea]|uniref:5'-methylthioadenosine/adenosylhomocysteine nucleosidase n=1 Tax=Cellulomonas cellasea TaxID=43670 RepID=UPI0025A44541|nr:5'-methylthioadenosine/adenosylhomocysteine nucleosidase [Cellulomonas cellasea]MDM8083719.1 5'-methylthioadenosine/adenosylhomocysteine nucleosidase [Cellulomonas cellasea]